MKISQSSLATEPQIAVIQFWNASPHLEISIEIALQQALEENKKVVYCHWGRHLPFVECYATPTNSPPREDIARKRVAHFLEWLSEPPVIIDSYSIERKWLKSATLLKRFTYEGAAIGRTLYGNLVDITKELTPCVESNAQLLNRMARSYISAYLSTLKLLDSNPTIRQVITFNGRHVCYSAVYDACSARHIAIRLHERGGNDDHYSLWPEKVHSLEALQQYLSDTWDSKTVSDRLAYFETSAKLRERINSIEKANDAKVANILLGHQEGCNGSINTPFNIIFFSSCTDEYDCLPDKHMLCPPGPWDDQRTAVLDILKAATYVSSTIRLNVRLHPNLGTKHSKQNESWDIIRKYRSSQLSIIEPCDRVSSYQLLRTAQMIFVYHSTIGAEALALGRKVYAISSCGYDDLDGCISIDSFQRIRQYIQYEFEKMQSISCDKAQISLGGLRYLYCISKLGKPFRFCKPGLKFRNNINN